MIPPHSERAGEVVVTLGWPNKLLSPNARAHHFARSRAAKKARADAFWLAWEAIGCKRPGWARAALSWEFCPPSKRRYDTDNLVAQHKAAQDGISDALGVDDSLFQSTYRMGAYVKGGAVIVTVRGIE